MEACCAHCERPYVKQCCCEFPPVKVCDNHGEEHEGEMHCCFASGQIPKITTAKDCELFIHRKISVEKMRFVLSDQLSNALNFKEAFSTDMDSLIIALTDKKTDLLAKIDYEISLFIQKKTEFEVKLNQFLTDLTMEPQNNIEMMTISTVSNQFKDDLQFFVCYQSVKSAVLAEIEGNFTFKFDDFWFKPEKTIENQFEIDTFLPNGEFGYYIPIFFEKWLQKRFISPEKSVFPLHPLENLTEDSRFCLDSNSNLLITGGNLQKTQSFRLNLKTKAISPLPNMNFRRGNHGMVYFSGKIYVFGGFDGENELADSEKLIIGEERWGNIGKMTKKRCGFTPCTAGNTVFIVGGVLQTSCEVFSVISDKFKSVSWKLPSNLPAIAVKVGNSLHIFQENKRFTVNLDGGPVVAAGTVLKMVYRSRVGPVLFRNQWFFLAGMENNEVLVTFDVSSLTLTVG